MPNNMHAPNNRPTMVIPSRSKAQKGMTSSMEVKDNVLGEVASEKVRAEADGASGSSDVIRRRRQRQQMNQRRKWRKKKP